ncbi:unnamed protein product [Trypanosoma congolense IL3000]|uniref:WGS project CAEQ00000000 data, annotated contig 2180 n=1 Tax=Trypanosoma congolense (strain IL3000) TaxID=1068625 RepID=F9WC36_TRYCI|nr:unnamed protein product [Trypanosoma congolense IL3000]
MLDRLHDNAIKDVRYLVGDGIITLCDWALRGASTSLDHVPRGVLDEAIREASKHPRPAITSGSMSMQSSNEESDKLTYQVAGTSSTQRQRELTKDNEQKEILWRACQSWEGVRLVDFLTQEYGKTHEACDPNVTLAASLEDPSHYIEEDAELAKLSRNFPRSCIT